MSNTVFTVQVPVLLSTIQSIVPVLNRDLDEDDDDFVELTEQEVLDNPKLLEYICTNYVKSDDGSGDVGEMWNMDCWWEWKKYR